MKLRSFRACLAVFASVILSADGQFVVTGVSQSPLERTSSQVNATLQSIRATVSLEGDLFNAPLFELRGVQSEGASTLRDRKDIVPAIFKKKKSTIWSDGRKTWTGTLFDERAETARTGFATIIQYSDGDFVGSFSTEKAAYSLVKLPSGEYEVRMQKWKDIPEGSALESPPPGVGDFRSVGKGKVSASAIVRPLPIVVVQEDGKDASVLAPVDEEHRELQSSVTVDILIAISNRAMCEFAGRAFGCASTTANRKPMADYVPIMIQQTNDAFSAMAVPITLRLVSLIFMSAPYDPTPDEAALITIRNDANVRKWRRDSGADLVSFITGPNSFAGGIAYLNAPESANSYTAFSIYVLTHELGHNFGCRHDRKNCGTDIHPYGHAWQWQGFGASFRTVMAYQCSSGDCPVVPYFSAKEYTWTNDGRPFGDAQNDNARLLRENGPAVSKWMAPVKAPVKAPVRAPVKAPVKAPVAPPPTSPSSSCEVFAEGFYFSPLAGYCYSLTGNWWNNKITHIRSGSSTCIEIWENDPPSGRKYTDCRDVWIALTSMSRLTSYLCCPSG